MPTMTPMERAWVAGLLEGEGCFFFKWRQGPGGKSYPTIQVRCSMTDRDVIERLYQTVGDGTMSGPILDKGPNAKPQWLWALGRRQRAEEFMREILPLMGERRSAKIRESLEALDAHPLRSPRHGTAHMYSARGCRCDDCRAAHAAKHRRMRAARAARKAAALASNAMLEKAS